MSEKILIVDDDPEILELCTSALAHEEYEITTSTNGEEAFDLVRQQSFDLVLSDIRMPGMDGLELLENLKKLDEDQTVIMFSGFGDVDVAVDAMKLGAFDSLAKPLSVDELKITIHKALRQHHLKQENRKLKMEIQENYIAMAAPPKVIPLLQNFTIDTSREFIELGEVFSYSTHETVLEEGISDHRLYIVFDGEFSVWQEGAQICKLGRGECHGEMNIFRLGLRSQSLIAETPGQILVLEKQAILNFFNQKEERIFKLFVFNALNSIYTKYRKTCSRIYQLERKLKG